MKYWTTVRLVILIIAVFLVLLSIFFYERYSSPIIPTTSTINWPKFMLLFSVILLGAVIFSFMFDGSLEMKDDDTIEVIETKVVETEIVEEEFIPTTTYEYSTPAPVCYTPKPACKTVTDVVMVPEILVGNRISKPIVTEVDCTPKKINVCIPAC